MEGDDPGSHHHHHHHHPITMVTSTNNPSQPEPCSAREAAAAAPPAGKVESGGGVNPPHHHADPCWDGCSGAGLNKGGRLPPLVETHAPQPHATESPGGGGGGVSVKVATTLLQPICLGDSPVVLPIHLQMSGGGAGAVPSLHGQMGALHGQMGATPYFMTSQGALSLPLVLDPQLLQHLSSQMASGCPALPLQNNVLCQNASLTFGLPPPPPPPPLDQKSSGGSSSPDSNLLSLLQNPAFAAILQDLFTSQAAASSACQSPGSAPGATDPFASAFFASPPPPAPAPPPPLSHPYASPLAPLVPPATLLVPYPVVIPLPVPLPIPLPIPVPVVPPHGHGEDSKGNVPRSVCTVSRSTQTTTCTRDATSSSSSTTSHTCSARFGVAPPHPPHAAPPAPSSSEGEALDLSVRLCPAAVQPKLEFPSPPQQDNVLDLSVAGSAKKKYMQQPAVVASSLGGAGGSSGGREFGRGELSPGGGGAPPAPSMGALRPMEGVPTLDSKLLMSGLASLEFSRQHKWLQVDASGGGASGLSREAAAGGSLGPPGGNLEMVSAAAASQTAKVIVSVKDTIPAFLCGKIKGLSGVSTKNFSIKRDGVGGTGPAASSGPVQQLYGPPLPSSSSSGLPAGEQHDPGDPLGRKAPKNRAIKVKKVGSQEIHFLPIKKQRLAAFLPRK